MKADYLVCYDIAEPRRLNRVFNYLKGKGIHLQYSVFYCAFTWQELQAIKERLLSLINSREDDIRIYPLPSNSLVEVLGCGDRIPEGMSVFIE